jgi:hypothetical protein
MDQLNKIKAAIWYGRLSGHYTYDEACDYFELLLTAKAALLKEAK